MKHKGRYVFARHTTTAESVELKVWDSGYAGCSLKAGPRTTYPTIRELCVIENMLIIKIEVADTIRVYEIENAPAWSLAASIRFRANAYSLL